MNMRNIMRTTLGLSLFVTAAGGCAVQGGGSPEEVGSGDEALSCAGVGKSSITRAEIIARAKAWMAEDVHYSQTTCHADRYGSYRADCSGFVSMAWALRSSYVTSTLPQVSRRLASKSELQPGDILLNPASHVVLFEKWANAAKTAYWGFEETRPGENMQHHVVTYPYYKGHGDFYPYRYDHVAAARIAAEEPSAEPDGEEEAPAEGESASPVEESSAAAATEPGTKLATAATTEAASVEVSDADADETAEYWTEERLAAATPLDRAEPTFARPERSAAVGSGVPFDGVPAVGALFSSDGAGAHYCTASVVASSKHNLVLTAAHCIHGGRGGGYRAHLAFVPQYHRGVRPHGTWIVKKAFVDARWASSSDADLDFGFVAVNPVGGRQIANVVGANRLAINRGFHNVVQVIGYPSSADRPITCRNETTQQARYQLRFACGGYSGGTSGSPWITNYDARTGTGDVIGVIGGYQEGGNSPDVSYSSYFDGDVQRLHDQADRGS